VGLATALPVGSPPTSHTDIVVPVAFQPRQTASQADWISRVRRSDVTTR
jgi:hypothetical protein